MLPGKRPEGRVGWRVVCSRSAFPESDLRSDHDALDFVDGDGVGRPVVELRRYWACSMVPPFDKYAVIPVARNV